VQHIEMARDIGARFNHLYGEHFRLPQAAVEEHVATLPGLDGRKMSKSYDNTIPLFCSRNELKKLIAGIVTDSRMPGEAKDADASNVFELYRAFASSDETAAMRKAFADGIGWGDAKQKLFERIDAEIAPLREKYEALIAEPARIEEQLRHGAEKARVIAKPLLVKLRDAVGLLPLDKRSKPKPLDKFASTSRKFYSSLIFKGPFPDRSNNTWLFRIEDSKTKTTLLHSKAFDSISQIGQYFKCLKQGDLSPFDLRVTKDNNSSFWVIVLFLNSGEKIAEGEGSVDREEVVERLAELKEVILENRPLT
jgi:tryptophanyl-tRNA synthetase